MYALYLVLLETVPQMASFEFVFSGLFCYCQFRTAYGFGSHDR